LKAGTVATSVGAAQGTSPHAGESKVLAWVIQHRKAVTWGALILLLAAGAFAWNFISTRQSERVASQQLSSARFALESKNYALAASELSRIAENYSGSRSADEASILLAQTRLAQGQSQQAIDVLKQFAPKASADYRSQAYGLLGAAYENVGHPKEAAEAYEEASKNGRLPFERAQFLSDAGRSWLAARDTGRAVAAYQEIVSKLDSTGSAFEAKVRLGELQAGPSR
jgi:predicted negative regulator of RcsB-dependent stress response